MSRLGDIPIRSESSARNEPPAADGGLTYCVLLQKSHFQCESLSLVP